MSNLAEAKESLAKATQLAEIIEVLPPLPKGKRTKLPLARDINMIEQLINNKLRDKKKLINDRNLIAAKALWKKEVDIVNAIAVDLKDRVKTLSKLVENKSHGSLTIDIGQYSGYWGKLPEDIKEAEEDRDMIEIKEEDSPIIKAIQEESEEYLLDIKLGLKPISDIKALLEKIDKI